MTASLLSRHLAPAGAPDEPIFHPVAVRKLVVLSVCTFGFYRFYWFYRNWSLVRDRTPFEEISPFWRTLFAVVWCHGLFARIRDEAERAEVRPAPSPGALTVLVVALSLTAKLPGAWRLLSFAGVLPVAIAQRAVNATHAHVRPGVVADDAYSLGEWLLAIGGGIVVLFAIVGMFLPRVP